MFKNIYNPTSYLAMTPPFSGLHDLFFLSHIVHLALFELGKKSSVEPEDLFPRSAPFNNHPN